MKNVILKEIIKIPDKTKEWLSFDSQNNQLLINYVDRFGISKYHRLSLDVFKHKKDSPLSLLDELTVYKLYENKISPSQLAVMFGCNVRRIWFVISRLREIDSPSIFNIKRHGHCKYIILDELKIVRDYLSGHSALEIQKITKTDIKRIITEYNVVRTLSEAQHVVHKTKPPMFKFPLTTYVPSLIERGMKNNFRELIATLLLTDGYLGNSIISMGSTSKIMCDILADLIYYQYGVISSSAYIIPSSLNRNLKYYIAYSKTLPGMQQAIKDLLVLSPTFIKSQQTEQQPTVNFLLNKDKDTVTQAIRLAMSADGSISPIFHFDSYKVSPRLDFACYHSLLVKEWRDVFKSVEIEFRIDKNKNSWSGVAGLETAKIKNTKIFAGYGGFIDDIIIRKGRHYIGLTKNAVMKAILKSKDLKIPKNIPLIEKHKLIHQLAKETKRK